MLPPHSRRSIASLAFATVLLAACGSSPMTPEQKGADVESRTPQAVTSPPSVTTVTPTEVGRRNLPPELSDPKNILSRRSIYFDYDRFDIKDEYRDLVSAHGKFLGSHRDLKILVQGNTDERGSREYNLALGQKRADAVKRALTLLGARDEQIEAVSLGEEKPKAEGQNEASWAQNRRSDILYAGEY